MAKIVFNKINISKKINGALTQKRFLGLAQGAANTRFVAAKNDLIESFNSHPITQEILAGPETNSQFLYLGNIVSFLGISNPEEVISEIRNNLQFSVRMLKTPDINMNSRGVTYSFRVKTPTIQEIYKSVPSPDNWAGNKGVIELIEKGVNNILYFVYFKFYKESSRSGHGLQLKKKGAGRSGKVLGIPYISEILFNFLDRFSRK